MMEMLSVGTLRDAVRQAGMRSKVELKKRSGTLQSHTAPEGLPARKTAEASIYQQMVNEERDDAKKGLATLCIGGMGCATIVEKI